MERLKVDVVHAMKKVGHNVHKRIFAAAYGGAEIMFFVPAAWDPGVEELPCIS